MTSIYFGSRGWTITDTCRGRPLVFAPGVLVDTHSGATVTGTTSVSTGTWQPRAPQPPARRAIALMYFKRAQDVTLVDGGWLRPTLPGERSAGVSFDDVATGDRLVERPPRCWRKERP